MADINTATISGRLTKDPELRALPDGTHTCSFTVACNRPKKAGEDDSAADFIQCVAWRQQADYLTTYCHKGDEVGVTGKIRTRSYVNRDSNTVYVTEIKADSVMRFSKSQRTDPVTYPEPEPVTAKTVTASSTNPVPYQLSIDGIAKGMATDSMKLKDVQLPDSDDLPF